jgi:hypothetical protein
MQSISVRLAKTTQTKYTEQIGGQANRHSTALGKYGKQT